MKTFIKFLGISYVTAIFFEFLANTIGDGKLFQGENWVIFFFVWYGAMYTILYFLFRKRNIWFGVVFLAILGYIAEIVVFQRSHIIDFLIYALMAFFPLLFYKKRLSAVAQ